MHTPVGIDLTPLSVDSRTKRSQASTRMGLTRAANPRWSAFFSILVSICCWFFLPSSGPHNFTFCQGTEKLCQVYWGWCQNFLVHPLKVRSLGEGEEFVALTLGSSDCSFRAKEGFLRSPMSAMSISCLSTTAW